MPVTVAPELPLHLPVVANNTRAQRTLHGKELCEKPRVRSPHDAAGTQDE